MKKLNDFLTNVWDNTKIIAKEYWTALKQFHNV